MTICLTLACKGCSKKFLATFDEDQDPQEYCKECSHEPPPTEDVLPPVLDSMSKLIVPDEEDLQY